MKTIKYFILVMKAQKRYNVSFVDRLINSVMHVRQACKIRAHIRKARKEEGEQV